MRGRFDAMGRGLGARAAGVGSLTVVLLAGCFPLAPLADCEDRGGLYVAHHVCMPQAGPPVVLAGEPVALVAGDFDGRGAVDDLAVLLDPDVVQVFTSLDMAAPQATWSAALLGDGREIEGLANVRYFDEGLHGEDLIAWTAATALTAMTTGSVLGLRNGGDVFAGQTAVAVPLVAAVDGEMRPCPLPNSVVGLRGPGAPYADALALACAFPEGTEEDLVDVVVIHNDPATPLASQAQVGVAGSLVDVHAAVAAAFADGLPRLIVAHRPPNDDHDQLAILTVEGVDVSAIEVAPRQGFIDQIATADLDADGDLDIVTLHSDERGLSIVTQEGPLKFTEPLFYSPGAIVTRVVAGEFTGDDGVDLAVAHVVENSRRSAITMFVRGPDAAPGTIDYSSAVVGEVDGDIVDLVALDFDGDERTDLAAAVVDGTVGTVSIYLHRSPGDVPGSGE